MHWSRWIRPFRYFARLSSYTVVFVSASIGLGSSDLDLKTIACSPATQEPEVKLVRVPPKSPEEALKAFQLAEGFGIELVAAEPLVVDPVAAIFDEHGRLVVIEMVDYSERDQARLGRVVRLEDVDNDGRMDQSTLLAENLSWPTALALMPEGVLVVHPPSMSLIRELESGEIQIQERFRGLSRANVQGMANSFRWGLDNRWHLSTSSNGGELVDLACPDRKPIPLHGRDLAIDPRSWSVTTEIGGGQHGMDFSPFGDKFVTSNSDHLQQIVAWDSDSQVLQDAWSPPAWRRSIASDGPQADVFRISPVEAWRDWRTQLRLRGKHPGLIEGGGRAAGYFTGATGVFYLDGDQLGLLDPPHVVVADVGGNLVHRKRLEPNGVAWRGDRVDLQSEFVRSSDIWFRPVQFFDGPDGALYILDMYREVIEHPASLPPPIKSQLDLNAGSDRGRIWRVFRQDQPVRRQVPNMVEGSAEDWVTYLDHPNGWHRETASRLLYLRSDLSASASLLQLAMDGERIASRVQALHSLSGIANTFQAIDWPVLLSDPHPAVRRAALQVLGRYLREEPARKGELEVWQASLERSVHGADLPVRFAFATNVLPHLTSSQRLSLIPKIIADDWGVPELRAIVIAASGEASYPLWRAGLTMQAFDEKLDWIQGWCEKAMQNRSMVAFLEELPEGVWTHADDEITSDRLARDAVQWELVCRELRRRWSRIPASEKGAIRDWVARQHSRAEFLFRPSLDSMRRTVVEVAHCRLSHALVELMACESSEIRTSLLHRLANAGASPEVQRWGVEAWIQDDLSSIQAGLSHFREWEAESQNAIVAGLVKRQESAQRLLEALERGEIPVSSLSVEAWRQIEGFPGEDWMKRVRAIKPRSEIIPWEEQADEYRRVWLHAGDERVGKELFQKHCASCHRHRGIGADIGPGLGSLASKSNDQIGMSIAEPSREVDSKFQVYQWMMDDGELVMGLMEESLPDRWLIRDAKGERRTLLRAEVERSQTSGKSLMPDGLLQQLSPEGLNDLIAFLRGED